jgi:Protein of unknown function (DUF3313)
MIFPYPVRLQVNRAGSMALRVVAFAALSTFVAACQSMPTTNSGYLSSYEGFDEDKGGQSGPRKRRDDTASNTLTRVYIQPSVLKVNAETPIGPEDQAMVRREVDRQLCFTLSRRFDIAATPEPEAGRIRTAIVKIAPTSPAGSAVTAAAGFFIPVPFVKFRGAGISGGLAAESELLAPDGRQVAAITWAKSTKGLSLMDPSLSRVGDALQLADPFADAVGDAFATKTRKKRPIARPDPCARFGPRRTAGRTVGGALLSLGTGLYAPSVSGAGRAPQDEVKAQVLTP